MVLWKSARVLSIRYFCKMPRIVRLNSVVSKFKVFSNIGDVIIYYIHLAFHNEIPCFYKAIMRSHLDQQSWVIVSNSIAVRYDICNQRNVTLFQQLVQTNNQRSVFKRLERRSHQWPVDTHHLCFSSQRAGNAESVPILWRHHPSVRSHEPLAILGHKEVTIHMNAFIIRR